MVPIRGHGLNHSVPDHTVGDGGEAEAQGQGWKNQMLDTIKTGNGKKPDLDRQDQDKQDGERGR